jgi:hypothetical protein
MSAVVFGQNAPAGHGRGSMDPSGQYIPAIPSPTHAVAVVAMVPQ